MEKTNCVQIIAVLLGGGHTHLVALRSNIPNRGHWGLETSQRRRTLGTLAGV